MVSFFVQSSLRPEGLEVYLTAWACKRLQLLVVPIFPRTDSKDNLNHAEVHSVQGNEGDEKALELCTKRFGFDSDDNHSQTSGRTLPSTHNDHSLILMDPKDTPPHSCKICASCRHHLTYQRSLPKDCESWLTQTVKQSTIRTFNFLKHNFYTTVPWATMARSWLVAYASR